MENRPESRKKNVSGEGKGISKRGEALNTGKVGNSRPTGNTSGSTSASEGRTGTGNAPRPVGGTPVSGGGNVKRSSGGGLFKIIAAVVVLLLGGGGGLATFLNQGASDGTSVSAPGTVQSTTQNSGTTQSSQSGQSGSVESIIQGLLQNQNYNTGTTSNGWSSENNTGKLNTAVAAGARDKRTVIKGNGQDEVTIMVYMCGTDLESRNGMATSDLTEMTKAAIADNVNLIVYTGGCTQWKNQVVSNSVNQIYQVKNGGLICLNDNAGTGAMTNPDTLTEFIKYCATNFPANRNDLIFWDHGGGSVTGYGYDEKNSRAGSMDLAKIGSALKKSNMTFDFIGFDACLMATLETGLLLDDYADYMVASEETEPGVGWYYTDWLTKLSKDTSMSTLEIGKNIADDFVNECNRSCAGQKTTLSVVDLAELKATVLDNFKNFATSMGTLIESDNYKSVSDARYNTREFAQSSKIDQIDLVHFANNMNNEEGDALAEAILGAVKYNKTSSNMTNAYGLSIYFPYRKVNKVDTAVNTYKQIGMDSEYSDCIMKFASLETTGQVQSQSSSGSADMIGSLLGSLLGGSVGSSSSSSSDSGITSNLGNFAFLAQQLLDNRSMEDYVAANTFDVSALKWNEVDGKHLISLTESQWSLVHDLALNVFYDDGEGYIDLGLDNVFEFDEEGNLIGDTDETWLAIDGQPIAYYYENTVRDGEEYTITGYSPAFLNDQRVNLIIVFDNEHPDGYLAGARAVYPDGETEAVAKAVTEINVGDKVDFICDYYTYAGEYENSYALGEPLVIGDTVTISNVDISEGTLSVMYRFTDIYENQYWTEAIIQ